MYKIEGIQHFVPTNADKKEEIFNGLNISSFLSSMCKANRTTSHHLRHNFIAN